MLPVGRSEFFTLLTCNIRSFLTYYFFFFLSSLYSLFSAEEEEERGLSKDLGLGLTGNWNWNWKKKDLCEKGFLGFFSPPSSLFFTHAISPSYASLSFSLFPLLLLLHALFSSPPLICPGYQSHRYLKYHHWIGPSTRRPTTPTSVPRR